MYMRFKLTDIHGIEVKVEVAREDDVLINTDHKYLPMKEAIISILDLNTVAVWVDMQNNITPEDLGFDIDDFSESVNCRDIDGEDYWDECGHYNQQRIMEAMIKEGYKFEKDN